MTWQTIIYFSAILLACGITGLLTWQAWRQRDVAGGRYYFWLALAMCAAALEEALSMTSPTQPLALFWFDTRSLSFAVVPPLWFLFVLAYSGRRNWLSKGLAIGLFAVPLVTQVMLWTSSPHGLWVRQEVGFHQEGLFWVAETAQRVPGLWFLVHTFYSMLLMLAGSILLLRTAWRKARPFRLQAAFLAASALTPVALTTVTIFNLLPENAFNPTIPGFGLAALLAAAAIFRFDFLKKSPNAPGEGTLQVDAQEKRSQALFLLTFALMVAGIAAVGYTYYRNYAQHFRTQVEEQLSAIAALKIGELEDWRAERLGDAEVLHQNPAFSDLVRRVLDDPNDTAAQEQLHSWLGNLSAAYRYERIYLLDTAGEVRISSPSKIGVVAAHLADEVTSTLQGGQVVFLDFHRHEADQTIHLAILVPIYAGQDLGQPLGMLVLEIDPATYLYPYLAEWPTPSETAETLLVRRDGEAILFLNPLRFEPNAALNLRIPLENTDVLAVKAWLGETGVVEGLDYRGQEVIGYVGPVPGSPWFLVARMDTSEVYAPLRQRLWQTIVFFGALVAASGAGLYVIWRGQRLRYYRARYEAAENLRKSEEQYRILFENNPVPMWVYDLETLQYLAVNESAIMKYGYTREEFLAMTIKDIRPPEDVPTLLKNITEAADTVQNSGPWRHRTKEGRIIFVEIISHRMDYFGRPARLVMVNDITERKRAEEERELLFNTLAASLNEIYIFDAETLKFQYVNSGALRNLQISLEQARQMTPLDIKPELAEAGFQKLITPLRTGEKQVQVFETVHRRADGTLYPVEVHLQLFESEKVFLAVIQDITERRQAEEQLAQYTDRLEELVDERTRELREAQEKLVRQERLAVLGQLAGSVGHELRNPLGVISNAAYYLRMSQPEASPKVRDYLNIIEAETRTAEKIITDLLDFSRIKNLDREPVDVAGLVAQTLERYPAPDSVTVRRRVTRGLPPVFADSRQMVQVLGNLLVNAYQAMEGRGKVTISARRDGEMVAISVADDGPGISPENMKRIFEPLFTTKMRGIGLGLAVSQRFVEANGGRIEVRSEPGRGSTFSVLLPVHQEEHE